MWFDWINTSFTFQTGILMRASLKDQTIYYKIVPSSFDVKPVHANILKMNFELCKDEIRLCLGWEVLVCRALAMEDRSTAAVPRPRRWRHACDVRTHLPPPRTSLPTPRATRDFSSVNLFHHPPQFDNEILWNLWSHLVKF